MCAQAGIICQVKFGAGIHNLGRFRSRIYECQKISKDRAKMSSGMDKKGVCQFQYISYSTKAFQ